MCSWQRHRWIQTQVSRALLTSGSEPVRRLIRWAGDDADRHRTARHRAQHGPALQTIREQGGSFLHGGDWLAPDAGVPPALKTLCCWTRLCLRFATCGCARWPWLTRAGRLGRYRWNSLRDDRANWQTKPGFRIGGATRFTQLHDPRYMA